MTQGHICTLVNTVTKSSHSIKDDQPKHHFFWNVVFLKLILGELYLMDVLINGCTNLLFGQFQFVLSVLETDISSSNHLKSLEDPNMSTQNFIPLILDKKKKKKHTLSRRQHLQHMVLENWRLQRS